MCVPAAGPSGGDPSNLVQGAFENLSGSSFRSGLRLRSPVRRVPFTAATAPITITAAIVDFFVRIVSVPGVVVVGGGAAAAAARPPPVGRVGPRPGPRPGPLAGAAALPAEVEEMKIHVLWLHS